MGEVDQPGKPGMTRRAFNAGATALTASSALSSLAFGGDETADFPQLAGLKLKRTLTGDDRLTPTVLEVTEEHVRQVSFPALEKEQIESFAQNPDQEVVIRNGKIDTFYGITRQEVEVLPGLHPSPDVYTSFQFRDKRDGIVKSCCNGSDCRPAIIRMLGNSMIAIGVHYEIHYTDPTKPGGVAVRHIVLFFKLHIADTNIVSTDQLLPGNKEYTKHKYHACVYQGRVYCAGIPVEG